MASLNFCCRTIVPCVALILNCCCLNLVDYGCMCQCVECMPWNTRMLEVVRVPAALEEQVKLCISWFCWAWRLAKNWPEKQPSEDNGKLSGCCSRSSGTCSWTQDVRVEITECIYGQEPVRKSPRNANLWFSIAADEYIFIIFLYVATGYIFLSVLIRIWWYMPGFWLEGIVH